MRVAVIGLGSMGKRRIRLLMKLRADVEIIGIDSNVKRCRQVEEAYGIRTFQDLEKALQEMKVACAVISTSPLSHAALICRCLEHGLHVFTEINLVDDGYEENVKLAKEKDLILFLSSTFLYRAETEYIRERVSDCREPLNYVYHIGQYLPDWHPWESYQEMFLGDKRTNGCREIMAIELPWLVGAFGDIVDVKVIKSKNTQLHIDYADNYMILLEHERGNKGMLAVDVVSRKAVRKLEAFGEHIYLSWDGTPDSLLEYDLEQKVQKEIKLYQDAVHEEGYGAFIIENAYEKELEHFIKCVEGEEKQQYSFEKDKEILKWIDMIEG